MGRMCHLRVSKVTDRSFRPSGAFDNDVLVEVDVEEHLGADGPHAGPGVRQSCIGEDKNQIQVYKH